MKSQAVRTAGVIAGIIVVLGILALGAQYLSNLSGGASAQVVNLEQLPPSVSVSREDYTTMLSLLDRYTAVSDLATKNQIFKELRAVVTGLVK